MGRQRAAEMMVLLNVCEVVQLLEEAMEAIKGEWGEKDLLAARIEAIVGRGKEAKGETSTE